MNRPSPARLIAFASGDFAFNLYWQSMMLYLLFYYTDVLGLAIGLAATLYVAASVWDGVASLAVGALADRYGSARAYRMAIVGGAAPLGLAFVLAWLPPPAGTPFGPLMLLASHIALRTAYAVANVPYLAMSARISADGGDRAFVAGLRMLAGTVAAVVVATGTLPLGAWLGGDRAYLGSAIVFAVTGTAILLAVGLGYRDGAIPPGEAPPSIAVALVTLARNRAFVTLCCAMMAMIVAVTMLNKSVLYYFKYRLGDADAGQLALGAMMGTSALAVPLWMVLARGMGTRRLWFVASSLGAALLAAFAAIDVGSTMLAQAFLVAMQVAIVGLNFALWAMLPDTIEYGQRDGGIRVEGMTYGVAAMLQRIAIGLATALLGLGFGQAGYVANRVQSAATLDGMRLTIALVPMAFLLLGMAAMRANPLRKGRHAAVLRGLASARAAPEGGATGGKFTPPA